MIWSEIALAVKTSWICTSILEISSLKLSRVAALLIDKKIQLELSSLEPRSNIPLIINLSVTPPEVLIFKVSPGSNSNSFANSVPIKMLLPPISVWPFTIFSSILYIPLALLISTPLSTTGRFFCPRTAKPEPSMVGDTEVISLTSFR